MRNVLTKDNINLQLLIYFLQRFVYTIPQKLLYHFDHIQAFILVFCLNQKVINISFLLNALIL